MNKKPVLATVFILVLLFSALVGVLFVRLAAANFLPPQPHLPSIHIRSDGSVDPSTAPIQRVGEVYTFTGNIANYTIEVQRNNIVVDGAGYTLQGNASGTGIYLSGNSVTIKNLEIKKFSAGINLISSSYSTITGNNITSNGVGAGFVSSSNNRIEGNKITGNGQAIILFNSSNYNSIVGNSITNNGDSIWSEGSPSPSNYNSIVGNNITNTRFGILIRGSSNCLIDGNNITNTENGIDLSGSSYSTITGNKIANNDRGISLMGGVKHNIIVRNNIVNNGNGIYFSLSSNNTIYHNNFIDNTIQVYDVNMEFPEALPPVNMWDDGYTSGGNYWSDYNSTDNNGDGKGDVPYIINANNKDRYPLMKPIVSTDIVIPEIPVEENPTTPPIQPLTEPPTETPMEAPTEENSTIPPTDPPLDSPTDQTNPNPTPLLVAVTIVFVIILSAVFYRRKKIDSQ